MRCIKFSGTMRYNRITQTSLKDQKNISYTVDIAIPGDREMKVKESKKLNKHQDLVRELKKLYDMKVTVIPIIGESLGTVSKNLEKKLELEIKGIIETMQIAALLKSATIIRRVLEI